MPDPFKMSEMSWTDYRDRVAADDPVVIVPVGAVEQHGPHLPLTTDCLLPEAVCTACAQSGRHILAPTLSYGYKSHPRCGGGQHFCGSTGLDAATIVAQVKDLIREFARHGVSKVAFVVGHMENQWFVTEGCDLGLREVRALGLRQPAVMNVGYWEFLSKTTIHSAFGDTFPDWTLEHAGIMETSMMLHLYPQLVNMNRLVQHGPARLPVYDLWPYDQSLVPEDGILNTALGATAQRGKLFFDEFATELGRALASGFPDSSSK